MSPVPFAFPAPLALPTAPADPGSLESIATPTLWAWTIGGILALFVLDFLITRKPHEASMREATGWSIFYVGLPLSFGGWLRWQYGQQQGCDLRACLLVGKSGSVDTGLVFRLSLAGVAASRGPQRRAP